MSMADAYKYKYQNEDVDQFQVEEPLMLVCLQAKTRLLTCALSARNSDVESSSRANHVQSFSNVRLFTVFTRTPLYIQIRTSTKLVSDRS